MAKEASSLQAKLRKVDSTVRRYVAELEKRNAKLHAEIVKLQADKVDRDNRIKALQKGERPLDLAERLRRAQERLQLPNPNQVKAKIRALEKSLGIPPEKRCQF